MAIGTFIELVRSNQKPGMVVAEVGCWGGESFIEWAPVVQANQGCCLLVDNFLGNPTAVGPHAASAIRRDDIANLLAIRTALFSNVRIIEGDSAEVANLVDNHSIDICFIDADHRYFQVAKDISAWMPKVKPGGILCGHDCESFEHDARYLNTDFVGGKHHGVIRAVSELVPQATLMADTCWKWRIPE